MNQIKRRIGAEGFRAIEKRLHHQALRLPEAQTLSSMGLIEY